MRSLILSALFTLAAGTASFAQTSPATGLRPDVNTGATSIFKDVEKMPAFNGSWGTFLQEKMIFPQAVLNRMETDTTLAKNGINERVVVKFIVCEDGGLCNMEVIKCNPDFPELGREALRVLKLSPAWKPGTNHGQPVKVYYTQPILFKTE